MVKVPGFVEPAVSAVQRDLEAVFLGDGGLDLGQGVGLGVVGDDAGVGEGLMDTYM